MTDLSGKRAVVTGAASGIGRAIAAELAGRGAQVLLADVNQPLLGETAAQIDRGVLWQVCDVSDHAAVEALAERARGEMGGADLVFANAGVIASGPLLKMKPAEVDWILGVNLRGAWSTLAVFGTVLAEQIEGGRLCVTGSEHSFGLQHAGAGIYTASKHAVLGLADVLRAELPTNVSISVLCPGLVASGLGQGRRPEGIPLPGGNPEFVAAMQARAMSAGPVARATVEGTIKGEFLIVTHPHAVKAAERRHAEVAAAFAAQAPYSGEAERYSVPRIMAEVSAELKAKRSS
ncbi:SDR family NAD(P)-dependent oxidoreductase [Novosphingobium sp. ERN07]|uniref:SDR family oxidoreductase n=1 Tax=Novosphingobium sp. ERN07 TaxID=2726187 RepID=UPI00145740B6|nr:SDR family NAD(P)-dependent oxidoreductase [Novosphingobium sp. ERN07]